MRLAAHLAVALLLALSACGGGADERWVHLARGATVQRLPPGPWVGGLELVPSDGGAWAEERLSRDDWYETGLAGVWYTERAVPDVGMPPRGGDPQVLLGGGREWSFHPKAQQSELPDVAADSFGVLNELLFLKLESGEEPPGELRYRTWVDRGAREGGVWRAGVGRYAGDGLPLVSGETLRLDARVPARSSLRFVFAYHGFTPWEEPRSVSLAVRLDGEELVARSFELDFRAHAERFELALPVEARRSAELEFALTGDPAIAAVLDPVIGPTDVGTYAARPWGDERPHVVVLLADTFRADNLATYGNEHALSPRLDAFAGGALRFRHAYSPASWTLPAHGSLFTGLFPHQHGAVEKEHRLPRSLATLAELFAAAGYRTGGITDAGFVSRAYGLDQGFQWWDEERGEIDRTVDAVREFLAADDGRPLFLFVQSYRTHNPYRVSDATFESHGHALALEERWPDLPPEANALFGESWDADFELPAEARPLVERMRRLYLGSVVDLDRGFGELLDELETRGVRGRGYVVFTSDHGEAFGEHERLFHGTGVWNEHVRVPLFVEGPGVAPGWSEEPVTLVDVAPTLASLAGLDPLAVWAGVSVPGAPPDRPLLSYATRRGEGGSELALLADGLKLIGPLGDGAPSGGVTHAYALDDPGEHVDLADPRRAELEALLAEHGSEIRVLLEPRTAIEDAQVRPDQAQDISAMGYGGDE